MSQTHPLAAFVEPLIYLLVRPIQEAHDNRIFLVIYVIFIVGLIVAIYFNRDPCESKPDCVESDEEKEKRLSNAVSGIGATIVGAVSIMMYVYWRSGGPDQRYGDIKQEDKWGRTLFKNASPDKTGF